MVRPRSGSKAAADPVRRPRPRNIGIIGKAKLSAKETVIFHEIGRCIAALGHTLVTIPAEGTASALREGVEREEGEVITLASGIIEAAEHTFIYPDPQLLNRLKQKYNDIEERDDVTILTPATLPQWYNAVRTVVSETGIPLPA